MLTSSRSNQRAARRFINKKELNLVSQKSSEWCTSFFNLASELKIKADYLLEWDALPDLNRLFAAWQDLILETDQLLPRLHTRWEQHGPGRKKMIVKDKSAPQENMHLINCSKIKIT